jgi:hypothetical protein
MISNVKLVNIFKGHFLLSDVVVVPKGFIIDGSLVL